MSGIEEEGDTKPSLKARTVAGFIVLVTSLIFFALDELDRYLFGFQIDFSKPAWALLVTAIYFFFGISLPDLLEGRRKRGKNGDN